MGRSHPPTFLSCSPGDIEKAFLQIRVKQQERDAFRFDWKSEEHSDTDVYRFTRALFGSSPFLLGEGKQHLGTCEGKLDGRNCCRPAKMMHVLHVCR